MAWLLQRTSLRISSIASTGRQCLTKSGPLAYLSYLNALSIFVAMVFLSLCLSVYLIAMVKDIPAPAVLILEDNHPGLDPQLHQQRQQPRLTSTHQTHLTQQPWLTPTHPTHLTQLTRVLGNRISKAWRGSFTLGLILACHIVMFLCIQNITYCHSRAKRVYLNIPNLLWTFTLASLCWHMVSLACCVKLVIEAKIFEENSFEEIELDILAGPVFILSTIFFIMTAPIYWVRQAVVRL